MSILNTVDQHGHRLSFRVLPPSPTVPLLEPVDASVYWSQGDFVPKGGYVDFEGRLFRFSGHSLYAPKVDLSLTRVGMCF